MEDAMLKFTAQDLQRNVAKIQEAALREPVTVSYHGRDRLVILPIDEFERLKRRDKQVLSMTDLPDEFVQALQTPYHNDEQLALDSLMDE